MNLKRIAVAGLSLMMAFAVGCGKTTDEGEKANSVRAKVHEEGLKQNEALKKMDSVTPEKLEEMKEKLKAEGRIVPPRPTVQFNIKDTNERLSFADAQRSYQYTKGAIKRCYMNAIVADEHAAGVVELTLRRSADEHDTQIVRYSSSSMPEGFETCMRDMAKRWPLPVDAVMSIELKLSSVKPPSIEELRRQTAGLPSAGHDHAHHGFGDHAQEAHEHGDDHPEAHATGNSANMDGSEVVEKKDGADAQNVE